MAEEVTNGNCDNNITNTSLHLKLSPQKLAFKNQKLVLYIFYSNASIFALQVFLVKEALMGCLALLVQRERQETMEHQVNVASQVLLDLR